MPVRTSPRERRVSKNRGAALVADVRRRGYGLLEHVDAEELRDVLARFGDVIHTEEVCVRTDSRALVTSQRALDVHTDHHRAEVIAWWCVRAAEAGGVSVLVDAERAFESLDAAVRRTLETVRLKEHCVFDGDEKQWALVRRDGQGRRRFYYSFWLADRLDEQQRAAVEAFREATRRVPRFEVLLRPGDVLAVDNGRMLHGRTAIRGERRLLRRHWLSSA